MTVLIACYMLTLCRLNCDTCFAWQEATLAGASSEETARGRSCLQEMQEKLQHLRGTVPTPAAQQSRGPAPLNGATAFSFRLPEGYVEGTSVPVVSPSGQQLLVRHDSDSGYPSSARTHLTSYTAFTV